MTPIGVFRDVQRPVYDDLMTAQLDQAVAKNGAGDLAALLAGGDTWTITDAAAQADETSAAPPAAN